MQALWSWFNERTGCRDGLGYWAKAPVPGGPCWCKTLPSAILFTFCIEAITGFFLWVYYSPSAQTAWESVYYLQSNVAGGWLIRAMHHYGAHVLLALLILYVTQSIVTGAYRAPRELVFWAAVGMGLCALAAVLTGDLLSWDQNGYTSTKTRTGFLTFLPWVGESLLKIAIGGPGPALGHLSLTRFFALHVALFGGGFVVLLLIHDFLRRRANAVEIAAGGLAAPFWPGQAWRNSTACLLTLGIILLLVCQHGVTAPRAGAPLLSPADTDPLNAYDAARPEWFLVGVYEFSHFFPGTLGIIPIFIVPGLLVCLVLAMPFVAQRPLGHFLNVVFTLALIIALAGLTYYSLAKDRSDPKHQQALAFEKRQAARVFELAQHHGIPPTGALTLLRRDPKTQGPRLFIQQCASCHDHAAGNGGDATEHIKAEKSSAPNLAAFASRRWIAGLLDPKQINGPQYFGETKFRGGKMAGWVKDNLSELDDEQKASLESVVMAVSAEARLPSQRQLDAADAKRIEEGREHLVEEFSCTDCHKFREKGTLGNAPDLTGYGSAEWIAAIIRNPADARFYGKNNDRMPAYASPSGDPAQDTLHPQQIQLLTDWLRGDWYEERADD